MRSHDIGELAPLGALHSLAHDDALSIENGYDCPLPQLSHAVRPHCASLQDRCQLLNSCNAMFHRVLGNLPTYYLQRLSQADIPPSDTQYDFCPDPLDGRYC